jgi:hypothetical protein
MKINYLKQRVLQDRWNFAYYAIAKNKKIGIFKNTPLEKVNDVVAELKFQISMQIYFNYP